MATEVLHTSVYPCTSHLLRTPYILYPSLPQASLWTMALPVNIVSRGVSLGKYLSLSFFIPFTYLCAFHMVSYCNHGSGVDSASPSMSHLLKHIMCHILYVPRVKCMIPHGCHGNVIGIPHSNSNLVLSWYLPWLLAYVTYMSHLSVLFPYTHLVHCMCTHSSLLCQCVCTLHMHLDRPVSWSGL